MSLIPALKQQFTMVPNIVLEDSLSTTAKMLYVYLSEYRHRNDYCWPSTAVLCARAHLCANTLRKYRRELEAAGLIEYHVKRGRFDDGKFGTRIYYLFTDQKYLDAHENNKKVEYSGLQNTTKYLTEDLNIEENTVLNDIDSCYRDLVKRSVKPVDTSKSDFCKTQIQTFLKQGYKSQDILRAWDFYIDTCNKNNPDTCRYVKRIDVWLGDRRDLGAFWCLKSVSRKKRNNEIVTLDNQPEAKKNENTVVSLGKKYEKLVKEWDNYCSHMMCELLLEHEEEANRWADKAEPVHDKLVLIEKAHPEFKEGGDLAQIRHNNIARARGGGGVRVA